VRRAIAAGAFREDLFYRLAVVQIEPPRLADRPEDVPALAEHFLAVRAARGAAPVRLSDAAVEVLRGHDWPGNVRELRNAVEHAAIVCGGDVILPQHLPEAIRAPRGGAGADRLARAIDEYLDLLPETARGRHRAAIEPVEEALIRRALAETHGNRSAAAELLGLHRNTLRKKLRRLGLRGGDEQ